MGVHQAGYQYMLSEIMLDSGPEIQTCLLLRLDRQDTSFMNRKAVALENGGFRFHRYDPAGMNETVDWLHATIPRIGWQAGIIAKVGQRRRLVARAAGWR
jgi:hypothetical protein